MRPRSAIFLLLAILGTAIPLAVFLPFVWSHGLDVSLIVGQLWQTPISTFFALDLMFSTVTFWCFLVPEGRRLGMKNLWIYGLCTLIIGLSLSFPLFLFFRDHQLNRIQ